MIVRIKLVIGVLLFTMFALSCKQNKTPNVILVITDDQRADALGIAGNTILRTPNLDKLANDGVYFKNAFVTTPICAASRASIMTSSYERNHSYTFGKKLLSKNKIDDTYFTLVKQNDIHTGFIGKFGVKFAKNLDRTLFDYYEQHAPNNYFVKDKNSDSKIHLTEKVGRSTREFLTNRPKNKPFCLTISYNAPHADDHSKDQYFWPEAFDTFYQNSVIPLPQTASKHYYNQQPEFVKEGFNRKRWKWRFNSPEKYQKMVKGYYRMISGVDRSVGELRELLEEINLDQNTIIIFTSDNGYFLNERQLAGKWLLYEESIRVPLIIYDPRSNKRSKTDDMVLNIDVAPTILDLLNIEIPNSYQGSSLMGYLEQNSFQNDREHFLCEHLWNNKKIPSSEGVRTKKYKYFRYKDYPEHEELYDLELDGFETNNLALDSTYYTVLQDLRKLCNAEIEKVK